MNDAFKELQCTKSETSNESMELLERFVVLMYDRASEATEVNDARKSRTMENIPPNSGCTEAAHQTYLLPGQLLEPVLGFGSRDARAI